MRAMLFAAGRGTRLAPLTDMLAKPAVPVGNQPLGRFPLQHLVDGGATEILVNTHHLPGSVRAALEQGCPAQCTLRFVHEPRLLGTGGGLHNAWRPVPGEVLVVANSDVLYRPDLAAALDAHRQSRAIATMIVRRPEHPEAYGAVEVARDGRVLRLLGRPAQVPQALERVMFTGVQILDPRAYAALPREGCIVRKAYRQWLAQGEVVMSILDSSPWREVGTLQGYLALNCDLAAGRMRLPEVPPPQGTALLDPDAEVGSGAQLAEVVVGAGAMVGAGVKLTRSVVWPGARADVSAVSAVITPAVSVHVPEVT